MKKKYEIGIKTHEFLLNLYEKENLHEDMFILLIMIHLLMSK